MSPRGFFATVVVLVLGAAACDVVLGLDEDRRLAQPPAGGGGGASTGPGGGGGGGAGGAAVTYEEVVLADEPIAYFRFEDSAPYADSIVPSRVLDVVGVVVPGVTGAVGQGLQFDGGRAALGPDDFPFLDFEPMTIEVWASTTSSAYQDVVGKYETDGASLALGYSLRIDATASWRFTRADGGQFNVTAPVTGPSMQHVVVTFDNPTRTSSIYVNGTLVLSKQPEGSLGKVGTTLHPFRLGGLESGNSFSGTLDELALYDKALPADRVRAHFEARPK